jgi:hypothetical protein
MITLAELKTKTVCFVGNGLFGAFARKVAPFFKKAYYAPAWRGQFPKSNQLRLWEGFPEFEQVKYPLLLADEIDLWVFLDVYSADLQVMLRERGARVFGAGLGEEIELDRWDFIGKLHELDLPVPGVELVTGVEALRKKLKGQKDKFIKLRFGYARGDKETWKYKNDQIGEGVLDEMQYDLGVFKKSTEFLIMDQVPKASEIGYDGPAVLGQWPEYAMQAYEVKGLGMAGHVKRYAELAASIRLINGKFSPYLRKMDYAGLWSTEIQGRFFLDPCARAGSPSNELLQEMFTAESWARCMWDAAQGVMTSPVPVKGAEYGMCLMIYSEQSGKNCQPLFYPKALDQWVKLRNGYREDGKSYSLPQGQPGNIAGVVGVGSSLEAAVAAVEENAKQVDGHLIEVGTDAIAKVREVIKNGEKEGIHF